MTQTPATPALSERLNTLAERLPRFPGGAWDIQRRATGSRLRLYECSCPVKVRAARDDLDARCNVCTSPFVRQELEPV
jgi:hypothetical protein